MKIGAYHLKLEKRATLPGWQAALFSLAAILVALALFSAVFILAEVSATGAYREIISYAFLNPFGLPLTLSRFIFLLLCTYAFIIPFRAGLWNIGMTGQLYIGSLAAYGVLLLINGRSSQLIGVPAAPVMVSMLAASMVGGAALAALAGFLRGKYNINEIVVTMLLNFIAFWLVSYLIKDGGPYMNPGGRGEGFDLPVVLRAPLIAGVPFTMLIVLGLGVLLYFMFARTRLGYQIRAYGHSPAAARYAGVNTVLMPVWVFLMGGALAGLSGYHYFAAVPGVYKIARNYNFFGDLAFYGIICGLIARGNPLAAIPVTFLFGGLSIGSRFVQGKLGMSFGLDYALLGVLMMTFVAFQAFYRYKFAVKRSNTHALYTDTEQEAIDVGVSG